MTRLAWLTQLRRPLLTVALLWTLAVALLAVTSNYRHAISTQASALARQVIETRGAIGLAQQQSEWVTTYQEPFQQLAAQGVLGPERRLEWAETLRTTAADLALPEVRFNIKPQQPLPTEAINSSRYGVFQSGMELTAELLHSADLVRLLRRLNSANLALMAPESCELKRQRPATPLSPKPTLRASCSIWWITVQELPDEPTEEFADASG